MVVVTSTATDIRELVRSVERYWIACRRGLVAKDNPLDGVDQRTLRRVLARCQRPGYETYLRTQRWRDFRALALEDAQGACQRCGMSERANRLLVLDVHHTTYARLGREALDDVEVLCRPCHEDADRERRRLARRRD